ncbi:MAG: hypothetical protein GF409_01660 [Candidatus Omnitrophica bacterium]|nr:hypothetical protein [Candidatus Omnitrophota bacterium]
MDSATYLKYTSLKEREFESLCKRCGRCCGASDDPCANLVRVASGEYFCRDYNNRLGPQRTVSGKEFNCVSIREHIGAGTLRHGCAYRDIV